MSEPTTLKTKAEKPWTLMFFFASDNSLSPSTLPQLKAIKAAGHSDEANVLVYFDPNKKGAPTRVFAINEEPEPAASAGSSGDPIITVLSSDYLKPDQIKECSGSASQKFAAALEKTKELKAVDALELFLGFCREAYPADHYMLFLVGHGLVVGRDSFLPDDNPDTAIGLETLGKILKEFKDKPGKGNIELVCMHSCSMSAVEIVYELKDTARYMLASQGLSFVGSWPYRQLLTKIYNDLKQSGVEDVDTLVRSLYTQCIQYGVDFMHAGYSSDMCLCSLDKDRVQALTDPISKLSQALQDGIKLPRCRDLITLAHLRSQSYWQETYTDLCDFCLCLKRLCRDPFMDSKDSGAFDADAKRQAIIKACEKVIEILKPEDSSKPIGPVVCADYVGPDVQFSHGLSIYFPWSDPREDENDHIMKVYENYAFSHALIGQHPWFDFLNLYFDKTRRPDRPDEEERADPVSSPYAAPSYKTLIETLGGTFPAMTITSTRDFFPTGTLEGKVTPPDSTGGACSCASMKNYSRKFSLSPGATSVFNNTKLMTTSASGGVGQQNQSDQTNPTSPSNQQGGPSQSS